MNHPNFRTLLILIIARTLVLPWHALAQPQQPQLQLIWGSASNGICAGIDVRESGLSSHVNDVLCAACLRNMTTNRLWVWLPPFEKRYEIELWGPDGRRIAQLKPLLLAQHTPYLELVPKGSVPREFFASGALYSQVTLPKNGKIRDYRSSPGFRFCGIGVWRRAAGVRSEPGAVHPGPATPIGLDRRG